MNENEQEVEVETVETEHLNDDEMAFKQGDFGEKDETPMFDRRDNQRPNRHKRAIFGVPVEVIITVGRANPSIGELLNLRRDALLTLDSKIDDPVDIMVGKRIIARGDLQEIEGSDGRLGVRLTEIVDLSEPF
jgi:flagellar motor switch protein FliN/FliY